VPSSLNNYALLVFLGAVWGASFVAIKYCSILFNPIEVGFFRTFIAAIFLAFFGILYYPVKRAIQNRKKRNNKN